MLRLDRSVRFQRRFSKVRADEGRFREILLECFPGQIPPRHISILAYNLTTILNRYISYWESWSLGEQEISLNILLNLGTPNLPVAKATSYPHLHSRVQRGRRASQNLSPRARPVQFGIYPRERVLERVSATVKQTSQAFFPLPHSPPHVLHPQIIHVYAPIIHVSTPITSVSVPIARVSEPITPVSVPITLAVAVPTPAMMRILCGIILMWILGRLGLALIQWEGVWQMSPDVGKYRPK